VQYPASDYNSSSDTTIPQLTVPTLDSIAAAQTSGAAPVLLDHSNDAAIAVSEVQTDDAAIAVSEVQTTTKAMLAASE
jgi:hypothetical protein